MLVVDDHPAVRAGIETVLAREPDLTAVAMAATPDQAMAAAHAKRPDVAVIDYNLPAGDGLTLARRMKSLPSPPGVLIYSAYADAPLSVAAVVAGADGIVDKGGDGDDLCRAIRCVAAGRSVRPQVVPSALRTVAEKLDPADVPILGMLWHRTPPGEIARVMGVTERWLNARRWAMLRRLTGPGQRGTSAA